MLRFHVINAVFKRNFLSYFSSVIGYLFIVVFVGAGSFVSFRPEFFANNLANLDQLNVYFPWLLLFIIPAITMSVWADERRQGTDELLFTLPATDFEILLGKYLAVLAIYSVALMFSLVFSSVLVLTFLTSTKEATADFDKWLILTNYFGYWLAGAALVAVGMFASILSSSTTVAFVLGVLFCLLPVVVAFLGLLVDLVMLLSAGVPGGARAVGQTHWTTTSERLMLNLGLPQQLRDFSLGIVSLSGVLYFASLAVLMLYLNMVMISKRHWSGGPHGLPMGLHYAIRAISLACILIGLNVVVAGQGARLDMTSEKIYTVYPATREAIQKIKPEHPVLIQAFISPTVPPEYVTVRTNLVGLLRQFDQIGGDRLKVRFVDTDQFTPQADEAKKFGIEGQPVQSFRGGRASAQTIYLGAIISSGTNDEVVIPFFDVGTPIEYELTRSIRTIAGEKRKKVGILTTDAKLNGGFDPSTFQQSREWRIVNELKKQYDVEGVGVDGPIIGDFDVLIAAMPSSLTEPQLTSLTEYVKSGKPVLIFDDPLPYFSPGFQLAPRQPKPSPGGGGMFGGGQQPPQPKADNGEATRLVNALGIAWNNGEVCWDSYNPHPEFSELLTQEFVFVGTKSGSSAPFSQRSEVTSGLQEMLLFYPGFIRPREGAATEFQPLLRSSKESGALAWEDLIDERFHPFPGMGGLRIKQDIVRKPDDQEHVFAARITSKGKADKDHGINVVYVADLDLISDILFNVRDREMYNLRLDNIAFVLNAVDVLAGDESLVSLRKRRARHRTLTRVEGATKAYKLTQADERRKADEDAKKKLDEAKQRFVDARKKIEEDKTLDPRTKAIMLGQVQEEESRRVQVATAQIDNEKEKRVQAARSASEQKIRAIERSIEFFAVVLPPIPALVLGLCVFFMRQSAERRTIVPDRLIRK